MKIFFLIVVWALHGCVSMQHIDNYEDSELNKTEVQRIAKDGGDILAAHYPPGKTIISLKSVGVFGDLLGEELRHHGFGVQEKGTTVLHYLLDKMDEQTWRLGLITDYWRSDSIYYLGDNQELIRGNQTQRSSK
ncbi:MAG: hypothetical protein Q4A74_06430 [Cardiobacteriaceae bacterium]|nr:hypothetical protein [Cardiobacteriaceae bacterium]